MKKCVIIALTALLPLVSLAQKSDFNTLFRKMSKVEGYTTVEITKDMIKLIGSNREQTKNIGDLGRVENIRMIVAERYSDEFAEKAKGCVAGFKLLTSVKSASGEVSIYVKEFPEGKSYQKPEMIVLSFGQKDNAIIHIDGAIDITEISAITKPAQPPALSNGTKR